MCPRQNADAVCQDWNWRFCRQSRGSPNPCRPAPGPAGLRREYASGLASGFGLYRHSDGKVRQHDRASAGAVYPRTGGPEDRRGTARQSLPPTLPGDPRKPLQCRPSYAQRCALRYRVLFRQIYCSQQSRPPHPPRRPNMAPVPTPAALHRRSERYASFPRYLPGQEWWGRSIIRWIGRLILRCRMAGAKGSRQKER